VYLVAGPDDYSAICNLATTHTWDTGDADGWAARSPADGALEMTGIGSRPTVRYTGAAELAQFYTRSTRG
jgi:hypothetical protein